MSKFELRWTRINEIGMKNNLNSPVLYNLINTLINSEGNDINFQTACNTSFDNELDFLLSKRYAMDSTHDDSPSDVYSPNLSRLIEDVIIKVIA